MEVTAAERTTIYTNISPLAQRVNNYIQTQHSSIAAVAKDIGYSRTTVSRYLTGKYDSNPNDLESKLTDFLTRQTGEAVDLTTPLAKSEGKTWQTPVFFESRDAKAVLGVCQSCQEYIGLGIVVARSGYGKTYALRQYAKLSRVAYIECDDTMSSRDLVEAIERSIGLPNGYGTIWRRVNGIREFFNTNKGYLLIIDEADKLVSKYTQKKMEILRAVFDQSDVGLVIAGEPKLEAQIKTYLVRMANRVDFYASLRGLSPSEVEGYRGLQSVLPHRHRRGDGSEDLPEPLQRGDQVPHAGRGGHGVHRHGDGRPGERSGGGVLGPAPQPPVYPPESGGEVTHGHGQQPAPRRHAGEAPPGQDLPRDRQAGHQCGTG